MKFIVKTTLNATAQDIYTTWLSSKGHSAMTGADATITTVVGKKFTAWDGYISGTNLELIPHNKIVQAWRTSSFKDTDEDSNVEIVLNEINGKTELTLTHSNIPKDREDYKKGWEDYYFKPMKDYFDKK
jgi:activator of HSP90 ATPase